MLLQRLLDMTESARFWEMQRPGELNRARSRAGECSICHGADFVTGDGVTGLYCACKVVEYEKVVVTDLAGLSSVSPEERLARFSDIQSWGEQADLKTLTAAGQAMRAFADNPREWIVLIGDRGCGKSHLMLSAHNLLAGRSAYVYVPTLADALHQAIQTRGVSALVSAYVTVPVLFLDDLGTEHGGSEFTLSMLDNIIQQRYQWRRRRPTVVATNLNRSMLNRRYPRLASRILDCDLSRVFEITLGDYRQRDQVSGVENGLAYRRIVR